MKGLLKTIMITGTMLSLAGCATMFGDKNKTISINSTPSGAKVTYNGTYRGVTPYSLVLASSSTPGVITVSHEGCQPETQQIQTSFQKIGFLNILFWPGFIVDAVTGDMMKIDNTSMNFTLDCKALPANKQPMKPVSK